MKFEDKKVINLHLDYIHNLQLSNKNTDTDNNILGKVCYAAYPKGFVFRPNRDILKCTVALDHPLNKVGYIDKGEGVTTDEDRNRLWYEENFDAKCKQCDLLLSCMHRNCPKVRVINHSNSCARIL